jgi:hypothetical protein
MQDCEALTLQHLVAFQNKSKIKISLDDVFRK